MKFVLANWGTRGDVEPLAALGRELVGRGHDVCMAVAPEMVGFAQAAGPTAVAYGPAMEPILDPQRDFWTGVFANPWRVRELFRVLHGFSEHSNQYRDQVVATLASLADGADLLLTGTNYQNAALHVAQARGIPLAMLHFFPLRVNGRLMEFLPGPLGRSLMTLIERLTWRGPRKVQDAQRREINSSGAADRGVLEIQAYDEVSFPGLAAEWAQWDGWRPFVGALSLELPTDADAEVASWIAAGPPPICFGFGSVGVESADDVLAMIGRVCAQLGERALVCAAGTDFSNVAQSDHVKVVPTMNHATALPGCRAFVHHGGAGTTNSGLRAGLPTLILWTLPEQGLWGVRVKRLKVGAARRFSATTENSLAADLRTILAPDYVARARELATRMTTPAESVEAAANLVENFARSRR